MESPVRICLGAALVVNLLLLSSTVNSNTLPEATTTTSTTTIKDLRLSRFSRNSTWAIRKQTIPDVALNELHPKETVSEEHTEKNAKQKDRGRVRFSAQTKGTQSPLRRATSSTVSPTTQASNTNLIIVTPTPEVKKPAQIIDSMRTYKKTKMPVSSSTTSIPVTTLIEKHEEEEYEEEEDENEKESSEKYTSSKFDSNFFTIPNYNNDFNSDSDGSDNKVKSEFTSDFSKSPYGTFSSYFPEVSSYNPSPIKKDDPYESESFFDFNSELTTPKNDFFDKKYEKISKGIIKNLDSIKTKTPLPTTKDAVKIVKENVGLEKINKDKPSNKSTVIIKNTKEIRLLDNEGAGNSANKALSDVHGTSIYYEMSVLSTETYNLDSSNDDDCENDALPDPTVQTSFEQELASIKATQPTPSETTRPLRGLKSESITTLSTNYLPFSSLDPIQFSSISPVSYSTAGPVSFSSQSSGISSADKTIRVFSNSYSRNRNYSKRLNPSGGRDSPSNFNKVDFSTQSSIIRIPSRKFHYTTPKIKPVWMAPRRNITRNYARSSTPTTIYSEYFSIKDKTTTPETKDPSKSTLTTVSPDIDPVLQSDVSGVKKVVHSQSLSDNSIPSLWKRGSTKYGTQTSTAASVEDESGVSDLEIPPTLTAWALASLRSPPSHFLTSSVNAPSTTSTQKSIDENELQNVGLGEKKITGVTSTTTTTANSLNNDIIPAKVTDVDQNRLPWQSVQPTETVIATETKLEVPAESNISIQSSIHSTTEPIEVRPLETTIKTVANHSWVSATETTTAEQETIPPVDATKSTGFESITKLPKGLTTPQDEIVKSEPATDVPTTTDYEITTIRFSYVPTEITVAEKEDTTWHPVFPTRTKTTTIKDEPITTYRPQYSTTDKEETETVNPEITSRDTSEATTEKTSTGGFTTDTLTTIKPTSLKQETTESIESTSMIVEVVTEINTERESSKSSTETTSTEISMQTETSSSETETPPSEIRESSSEENSGSNEVITQETRVTSPLTTHETIKLATETMEPTETMKESTTQTDPKITTAVKDDTTVEVTSEIPMDVTTRVEDMTTYSDVTTEASSRVLTDEAGSGAAVAIAVSTIGVIALILLVGLLLVVRRRGRRGVYAQRCTPVSLDAYSLDSVSVGHRKGNHRLRASKRSYGNPAYDDEVTSHPMQYAALANFALDIESMTTEFAEIPSVTVRPDEVPPGCEDKNRYSNVLPLPETRVPLKRIGNDPTTEYINANFITGPGNIKNYYIAAQAPLHNTVGDFWRMIWEQNSRVVVMLTEYMENGVEKCYEYLPPSEVSDNKRTFSEFQIILTKREQSNKYAISTVQLINLTTRTWREVTHLWYFWPAKGVPDDYDSVLDFLAEMRSYMKIAQTAKEYDEEGVEVIYGDSSRSSFQNLSKLREESNSGNGVNVYSPSKAEEQMRRGGNNGTLGRMKAASEVEGVRPCVVVCASGAGRSAAVIAADICARALAASATDVPRVVREIRAQRPHSMANRHHYIFLYKLLSEYGNKLMGGGVDTI